MLEKLEPELELYTLYDHGVIHKLTKDHVILIDDDSSDKITPRGLFFCSHHEDDVDFLVRSRKYKSLRHH